MITRELDAFVTTANVGSFQKASDLLFISSTALIKQINALEEETGLNLFIRTNRGIQLTEEGRIFHGIATDILQRYTQGIQTARNRRTELGLPVRIGLSPISPYQDLTKWLLPAENLYRRFTMQFIPISSDYKDFSEEMQSLGARVDVIPYILGQKDFSAMCGTFCLANLPLRVAVPKGHPLYGRHSLAYEDLHGQEIYTISSEVNEYYRQINSAVLANAPGAKLIHARYYDFALLNNAANSQRLVLAADNMKHVHPLFALAEGPWELTVPYGLYFGRHPSEAVGQFLDQLADAGISGDTEDSTVFEFA